VPKNRGLARSLRIIDFAGLAPIKGSAADAKERNIVAYDNIGVVPVAQPETFEGRTRRILMSLNLVRFKLALDIRRG
jgi:hypothetical protein